LARVAGFAPPEVLPAPPSTILIIEDDPALRAIVRRHLEAVEYRVLEAADGQVGLDLIEAHQGPLDLVLTDIEMPRIDGITVAEVLAALRPLVGVVCMSAGLTESRFVERLAHRSEPFLAKPFTGEVLLRALGVELARSRQLAAGMNGMEAIGPDWTREGVQPPAATGELVAAAQRLQRGHNRTGSTRDRAPPHANGRPAASEQKS
jgi:DNA-binding response OmpR family regulator